MKIRLWYDEHDKLMCAELIETNKRKTLLNIKPVHNGKLNRKDIELSDLEYHMLKTNAFMFKKIYTLLTEELLNR